MTRPRDLTADLEPEAAERRARRLELEAAGWPVAPEDVRELRRPYVPATCPACGAPAPWCQWCGTAIDRSKRPRAIYCNRSCQLAARRRRS